MNRHEKHAYVLSPTDVVRIRELLSMFFAALDRIFDRSETMLPPDAEEAMGDLAFYAKCKVPGEVNIDF